MSVAVTNFIYTAVQLAHNFGAATVVGGPAAAHWLARGNTDVLHKLTWLVAMGWLMQVASGIGFGLTSYYVKGHLPEVEGVALLALAVKITCAVVGLLLMMFHLSCKSRHAFPMSKVIWPTSLALGCVALSAAAFLRWYL